MDGAEDQRLTAILRRAHAAGFIGADDLESHIAHARAFARALEGEPGRFLDLGSGGGLPGLVLGLEWPLAEGVLVDRSRRRAGLLQAAIAELELGSRVRVICGRAEELGHDPELRERFDVVTARAFASPAVTAECGAAFLKLGGRLVVSGPPGVSVEERWPTERLEPVGLGEALLVVVDGASFAVLAKSAPCDPRYPRRIPSKRPLWS